MPVHPSRLPPARQPAFALGSAFLAAAVMAATASANAPPNPLPNKQAQPVPLVVKQDAESPVHRIILPANVVAALAGLAPADRDGSMIASTTATPIPTRSIAAAVAMSAAVACGLVAWRRNRSSRTAAVVAGGLAAVAGCGLLAFGPALADAPAPDRPLPRPKVKSTPAPVPDEKPVSFTLANGGKVIVEVANVDPGPPACVVLIIGAAAGPAE